MSVATATINITAVNDAPVATITPVSYAATEQVGLTLKGTGLSISDVDAARGTMTVTLAVAEGTLNVTAGTSGAVGDRLGHHVGDPHRHGGADQQPAGRQCHQHGQLHRQHRHAERPSTLTLTVHDAATPAPAATSTGRHRHHQHHRGQRRADGHHHPGDLRGDRAGRPHPHDTGISISDVDAGSGR